MKMRFSALRATICLGCLLLGSSRSADAGGHDFRNVRWGMNRYEVMASEQGAPKRLRRDEILYRIALFNRPAYLMYRFYEDRLVGARYVLPVKAEDTLETLARLVSLRYGASREESPASGEARVWAGRGRTVRLFMARKGQAIIDVVSDLADPIPSKEVALLRRRTVDTVTRNL